MGGSKCKNSSAKRQQQENEIITESFKHLSAKNTLPFTPPLMLSIAR